MLGVQCVFEGHEFKSLHDTDSSDYFHQPWCYQILVRHPGSSQQACEKQMIVNINRVAKKSKNE